MANSSKRWRLRRGGMIAAVALLLSACTTPAQQFADRDTNLALAHGLDPATARNPFPSTYSPSPSPPVAIVGASILTGEGDEIADGVVLMREGDIEAVGRGIAIPAGYLRIDGRGKWVTPGIIDAHSHLGVSAAPNVSAHRDHNEVTDPNTAGLWAEHSVWPQDPNFNLARAGGVTTLLILPGSANLFGGRSVTLKNVPSVTMQGMKFPGAPYGVKMACGENPKRNYGRRNRAPSTRMGNVAGYRKAWIEAAGYAREWNAWRDKAGGDPPERDLRLDTLAGVLAGDIIVHNHCYRADEMAVMLDIAREFGFDPGNFHHANEAYKIAPLLAERDVCVMTWARSWGSKMEAFDGIEANAAMVHAAGGCAIIHSDDPRLGQRLNQEMAIALAAGREAGFEISRGEAIAWITANPARALGIGERTGTLAPGKMADVVLWSADPFSVYARAEKVWIDGVLQWDSTDRGHQPVSDFELGQAGQEPPR